MPEIEKPLKSANMKDNVDEWDANYIDIDDEMLSKVAIAANFLIIKSLLDLSYVLDFVPLIAFSCAKYASLIKDKKPEEIRERFNIPNDFTPEEEARVWFYLSFSILPLGQGREQVGRRDLNLFIFLIMSFLYFVFCWKQTKVLISKENNSL